MVQDCSETNIRKRLKECASFVRGGDDNRYRKHIAATLAYPPCSHTRCHTHLLLAYPPLTRERRGVSSGAWVWKGGKLPDDDEISDMLSPEQVCAWESMKACEQRLADMGFTHVDDEDAEKVPHLCRWTPRDSVLFGGWGKLCKGISSCPDTVSCEDGG